VPLAALDAMVGWVGSPHWPSALVAVGVAATMVVGVRLRPGLPFSLIAVTLATVTNSVAGLGLATIGTIPSTPSSPSMPAVPWDDLGSLLLPASAVAVLAALESLLSATVSDAMSVGERHDPDRELFGQGVANIGTALFGGVPATAAIARTAVNVRSGAQSRLASVVQSVALLGVMLGASRLVSGIPLAALAGVLIATAVQMVEISSLRGLLRSTRGDAIVLVVTAVLTLAFDLVTAVVLGIVAAGAFALRAMARSARLDEEPLEPGDHSDEERSLLDQHIVAYRLEGPLFFGAAHRFLLELSEVSDVRVVVLRMSRVAALDATGAQVLAETITRLEGRGVSVMLSAIKPEHVRLLDRLGVYSALAHERHVFPDTPTALAHARLHAARTHHGERSASPSRRTT
jgi:SulP family sulfate permease